MEVIFYITIFLIGLLTGSFCTLAIHRLPLHENITHKRSYCPNCKHKLSFWDMFPVISYVLLGGKCRYCKHRISPKYIIIELLTGIVFVLFAISICNILKSIEILVYLILGLLYITGLIIISGIDKEKGLINEGVLLYELLVISAYIIYLYILGNVNIYRYVIYLFIILALLINDTLYLKRKLKNNYAIQIALLSIIMACFSGSINFVVTAIITIFAVAIRNILYKFTKEKNKKVPIAYFLCISNIIVLIIANIFYWVV